MGKTTQGREERGLEYTDMMCGRVSPLERAESHHGLTAASEHFLLAGVLRGDFMVFSELSSSSVRRSVPVRSPVSEPFRVCRYCREPLPFLKGFFGLFTPILLDRSATSLRNLTVY